MEKQPPQKALCLGPDPPLGISIKFMKIIDFYRFWAFNRAGKTVTKVGIYSKPPLGRCQKVEILEKYRFLLIYAIGLIYHYSWLRQIYRDPIDQEQTFKSSLLNFNARHFFKILL
jgi:hypothetical protein